MKLLERFSGSGPSVDKAALILRVVEKHSSWFPLYNGGREAPTTARLAWAKTLQRLSSRELLRLLHKHQLRDHLLGRNWPPVE
jgi:hypothetical protein